MNRIIISVSNDLVTDQRVMKTCDCFNEMGFEILLIGRNLNSDLKSSFPFKTLQFNLFFNKGFLFYAEFNIRLFIKLMVSKKNILYANDLDTLLPNFLISKIHSCKLIYDSHEYFTEVPELASRPKVKAFWLSMEKRIFPNLKNVITVNDKIAGIYQDLYQVPVTVIRNVSRPVQIDKSHSKKLDFPGKSIILYQGALNLGRGLELMIDSMTYLENFVFIIAGGGDISHQLRKQVEHNSLENKVVFLGRIGPDQLSQLTRQADIGISLEEDLGLNYHYCLPNKIFDYIQAKIPILVSDLPLLKDLLVNFNIGEIVVKRNPEDLALQVKRVVKNKSSYLPELSSANDAYNWPKEKKKLINFIKEIE